MHQIIEGLDMSRVLPLADWAAKEWVSHDAKMIVRRSKSVWSITKDGDLVLVIGVCAPTFASIPELWLLLCHGFTKDLRDNVRFIKDHFAELLAHYPRLQAKVEVDYRAGRRFAEFMGFKELQSVWLSDGKEYIVYEVK